MNVNSSINGIGMTSQRTRDRLVKSLRKEGIQNRSVLDVIRNTPRHLFMDEALASRAYENIPLPIGHGQTISQPYIVARMTELLLLHGSPKRVLEVGTGSGYQTAVLAQLVDKVYSMERIRALLVSARQRLRSLAIRNVHLQHSDGTWGWPERSPFDAILVTAAPGEIPQSLLDQLKLGGRMVAPVGEQDAQNLVVITRTEESFEEELVEPVSFVPLLSGAY